MPLSTIQHLFLDQVIPLLLAQQGKIILHASANIFGSCLLLFMGNSGSGKSTLAGSFHQMGYPALCDDCAWLKDEDDQVLAVPSYPGLRLWGDSADELFSSQQTTQPMAHYSSKRRIGLPDGDIDLYQNGAPVLGVILLQPETDSGIPMDLQRLGLRQAYMAMVKHSFLLDLGDAVQIQTMMQNLGGVLPKIKVWELHYPQDYAQLPLIQDLIIQTVL